MAVCVGDVGRALTPMSPSGAVEVNGQRLDARSDGGFIAGGSPVIVLRGTPTGYVVRQLHPGQSPPPLPNHGEPIQKAEFQRNSAEVAEVERRERAEARKRLLKGFKSGTVAAGSLGVLVGLASGGVGWYFGWAGEIEPTDAALLLSGSAAVGALTGVALFFLTGLLGSILGSVQAGETGFAPDFLAIFAALIGTAVGFWWQFGTGDAATIAAWSVGGSLICGVVALLLNWLATNLVESLAGGG